MERWRFATMGLMAALLAGCAAPSEPVGPGPAPVPDPAAPRWAWSAPTAINPAGEGFEPSIRAGPDGSLYIAAARGFFAGGDGSLASPVWVSRDGGATWAPLESPAGLRDRFKGIEGELAVDATGTVYFVDTYAADNVLTVWEADGAWQSTRPLHGTLGLDDRPWLAAHGDGILYAVGNSMAPFPSPEAPGDLGQAARIALYRSEDGGLTWTLGTTFPASNYCHVAASPADDASLAVACQPQESGGDPSESGNGAGAMVWWSLDRGATWTEWSVEPLGATGTVGFPSVSFDAAGRWCAAWGEAGGEAGDGSLLRMACHDGASLRLHAAEVAGEAAQPWLALAPDGSAALVALEREDGGPWRVAAHLARDVFGPVGASGELLWDVQVLDAEAQHGEEPLPDFFQAAFAPNGALHVAYARDPASAFLEGTNPDHTTIAHVRQLAGPTLARLP